jgi:enterochelin esterase-like enzyme
VAVIVTWRSRPGWLGRGLRLVAIVLSQAVAIAAAGVWANNSFGFYTNWADLLGNPAGALHAQANSLLPRNGAEGSVLTLNVLGKASKTTGSILVWLPPQYKQRQYAHTRFPVMMMMPGQPGTPEGVFTQFDFARQATRAIAAGTVKPFVGVFPPIMIDPPRDTECTNVPRGPQAESWLATDVHSAVLHRLRVTPDGRQWTAAGWSTGGFCAAKLALRHPAEFGAAISYGGYFDSETDHTTGDLFGGSAQLRRDNSPLLLIQRPGLRQTHLLIVVGAQDAHSYQGVFYADSKKMIELTRGYPNVASIVMRTGGHNYTNYRRTVPAALAWAAKAAEL